MKHPDSADDYLRHMADAIDRATRYEFLPANIRGKRNIAIHEYFFVDVEIVRKTVRNDFPGLKRLIDPLLKDGSRPARGLSDQCE